MGIQHFLRWNKTYLPVATTVFFCSLFSLRAESPPTATSASKTDPKAANSQPSSPTTMVEVPMDPQHFMEISQDLPATTAALDKSDNVWFIGQRYLWKWNPAQRALQQIKLATKLPLKNLILKGERVVVANDQQLFQIEIDPFKVISFNNSSKDSTSLSLVGEQSPLFWIKTDGIYELSPERKTLEKIADHNLNENEDAHYLYVPDTKTLWMTRNDELVFISYAGNGKPKKYGKIEKNINDIQTIHDEVFAFSQQAIFRYTKRGKLIQTVPVTAQRRIVASSLHTDAHAFIFHDRLLEMHLTKDKSTQHFYVDVGRVHKVASMAFSNLYVSLILDGIPRAFQFSNSAPTSS